MYAQSFYLSVVCLQSLVLFLVTVESTQTCGSINFNFWRKSMGSESSRDVIV